MNKIKNEQIVEGRLYDFNLSKKTVKNEKSPNYGKEFINGSISIATNEDGTNVLTIHYTFEPPVNSKTGSTNSKFTALSRIMESGKIWTKDGKDEATKLRVVASAALNDFYPNGGDELVSQQRIEGGFINFVNELHPEGINRQKFTFDTVITGADFIQADPERGTDNHVNLKCAIFDFRKSIMPYTLVAKSQEAMDYFIKLQYPVYTQVWGENVSTTETREKKTESAFGGTIVDYVPINRRELVVTGAKPVPYVYDPTNTLTGEEVITKAELEKAIADRNVYLEAEKTRTKEYYANRNAAAPVDTGFNPSSASPVPQGDFNFFG